MPETLEDAPDSMATAWGMEPKPRNGTSEPWDPMGANHVERVTACHWWQHSASGSGYMIAGLERQSRDKSATANHKLQRVHTENLNLPTCSHLPASLSICSPTSRVMRSERWSTLATLYRPKTQSSELHPWVWIQYHSPHLFVKSPTDSSAMP